jgi:hypothetical protein
MEDIEKFKKQLKWDIDLTKADYQIDALQNKLLQFYLRAEPKFRRAFYQNYTQDFIQFMKDKARLREPFSLSILGSVRSGKSVSAITLAILHSALNGRRFNINYICSNTYEFIEKIKEMPREELLNSCWISDEEKQSVYSVGSTAKKMKITDIQNIIAKNNLSVISISPSHWANEKAMYGLRAWGRCFQTKSCRFMLYNLQEGGKGGTLPLGCVYIPIFTEFAPKPYSTDLEKQYLTKKDEWIEDEMRGRGDVLGEIKKRSAMNFSKDKKYLALKGRDKCMAYLSQILGSEWTKGEVAEIYQITKLISEGILSAD